MKARWTTAVTALVIVAGTVGGAAPADSDGDGVIDIVEAILCGSATCWTDGKQPGEAPGRDAANGKQVPMLQRMLAGSHPIEFQTSVVGPVESQPQRNRG